ncbi:ATP synthase F1 complex subunit epsilon [Candidatus Bealeia paramacronuclearis]|uniref:ATP synthase epsilon chain n=1 Tax=Candidatus Bealeia paramacronuclearis TaxID=1921001 RepID=A0ABZ2C547_9PROT|nr:ATP synthase F1 complex subunit epsilon [Candidatus Bealeia paramacronuclearis]
MSTIHFSLVSPEKILFEKEVSMVVVPGIDGDIGVLPQHAPLLTTLRPGIVTVYEGDNVLVKIFVDGGFSEITPERCTALVTEGTPVETLDRSALELEIQNLLEDAQDSKTHEARQEADRSLEMARIKLMALVSQK